MSAFERIDPGCREVIEIDALLRALRGLKHWTATADSRLHYADDQGARLHAMAARLREEAWADSLLSAYRLFEIDAIHDAWVGAGGRQHD